MLGLSALAVPSARHNVSLPVPVVTIASSETVLPFRAVAELGALLEADALAVEVLAEEVLERVCVRG
jgi:hypothetical protein